jgi:hypothetical protein
MEMNSFTFRLVSLNFTNSCIFNVKRCVIIGVLSSPAMLNSVLRQEFDPRLSKILLNKLVSHNLFLEYKNLDGSLMHLDCVPFKTFNNTLSFIALPFKPPSHPLKSGTSCYHMLLSWNFVYIMGVPSHAYRKIFSFVSLDLLGL